MNDRKRELGKIEDIKSGKEDHGIVTCSVGIKFKGSYQGFGQICLDKKLIFHFENELCQTFGCKTTKELIGQECYALRCFSEWNSMIEGLESVKTQKRFLLNNWCLRYIPDFKYETPLEKKKKYYQSRIDSGLRQIYDAEHQLSILDSDYTDWFIL